MARFTHAMDPQEALFQAAKRGHDEDLEELLSGSFKVDVNKGDAPSGNTALHYAAAADHTKSAFILLNKGAAIDARNKGQETPLHRAAARGSLRTAKLLVHRGASLSAVDGAKQTPRMVAAKPELRDVLTEGAVIEWEERNLEDEDST